MIGIHGNIPSATQQVSLTKTSGIQNGKAISQNACPILLKSVINKMKSTVSNLFSQLKAVPQRSINTSNKIHQRDLQAFGIRRTEAQALKSEINGMNNQNYTKFIDEVHNVAKNQSIFEKLKNLLKRTIQLIQSLRNSSTIEKTVNKMTKEAIILTGNNRKLAADFFILAAEELKNIEPKQAAELFKKSADTYAQAAESCQNDQQKAILAKYATSAYEYAAYTYFETAKNLKGSTFEQVAELFKKSADTYAQAAESCQNDQQKAILAKYATSAYECVAYTHSEYAKNVKFIYPTDAAELFEKSAETYKKAAEFYQNYEQKIKDSDIERVAELFKKSAETYAQAAKYCQNDQQKATLAASSTSAYEAVTSIYGATAQAYLNNAEELKDTEPEQAAELFKKSAETYTQAAESCQNDDQQKVTLATSANNAYKAAVEVYEAAAQTYFNNAESLKNSEPEQAAELFKKSAETYAQAAKYCQNDQQKATLVASSTSAYEAAAKAYSNSAEKFKGFDIEQAAFSFKKSAETYAQAAKYCQNDQQKVTLVASAAKAYEDAAQAYSNNAEKIKDSDIERVAELFEKSAKTYTQAAESCQNDQQKATLAENAAKAYEAVTSIYGATAQAYLNNAEKIKDTEPEQAAELFKKSAETYIQAAKSCRNDQQKVTLAENAAKAYEDAAKPYLNSAEKLSNSDIEHAIKLLKKSAGAYTLAAESISLKDFTLTLTEQGLPPVPKEHRQWANLFQKAEELSNRAKDLQFTMKYDPLYAIEVADQYVANAKHASPLDRKFLNQLAFHFYTEAADYFKPRSLKKTATLYDKASALLEDQDEVSTDTYAQAAELYKHLADTVPAEAADLQQKAAQRYEKAGAKDPLEAAYYKLQAADLYKNLADSYYSTHPDKAYNLYDKAKNLYFHLPDSCKHNQQVIDLRQSTLASLEQCIQKTDELGPLISKIPTQDDKFEIPEIENPTIEDTLDPFMFDESQYNDTYKGINYSSALDDDLYNSPDYSFTTDVNFQHNSQLEVSPFKPTNDYYPSAQDVNFEHEPTPIQDYTYTSQITSEHKELTIDPTDVKQTKFNST